MKQEKQDRLLNSAEVGRRLGYSGQSVRNWHYKGQLPGELQPVATAPPDTRSGLLWREDQVEPMREWRRKLHSGGRLRYAPSVGNRWDVSISYRSGETSNVMVTWQGTGIDAGNRDEALVRAALELGRNLAAGKSVMITSVTAQETRA